MSTELTTVRRYLYDATIVERTSETTTVVHTSDATLLVTEAGAVLEMTYRFLVLDHDPPNAAEGWAYVNSVTHRLRIYDGDEWYQVPKIVGLVPQPANPSAGDVWIS